MATVELISVKRDKKILLKNVRVAIIDGKTYFPHVWLHKNSLITIHVDNNLVKVRLFTSRKNSPLEIYLSKR